MLSIINMFYRSSLFSANSEDSDQTPRSAASDQGLHCLPMYILLDARHKLRVIKYSARFSSAVCKKQLKFRANKAIYSSVPI